LLLNQWFIKYQQREQKQITHHAIFSNKKVTQADEASIEQWAANLLSEQTLEGVFDTEP
jgi:hypothetical protein